MEHIRGCNEKMPEQKVSEIVEVTLAKAYENIDSFDYCENITEKLRSHELINEDQYQCIRSGETSADKNQ